MKKILFIVALLTGLAVAPVEAKTAPVQALQDFSISNPSQTLLIKMLANVQLNKDTMLHEGYFVLGQIQNVSNSTFVFMPIKYQNFHNEVFQINGNYPAKWNFCCSKSTRFSFVRRKHSENNERLPGN